MAGARARKLDLSGFLSGNANVADLITRAGEAEARGISGFFGGISSGITQAGQNIRENKVRAENRADRLEERTYQRGRDKFREDLALRADARAEADQRIQEEDHKRKIASDAAAVEETANLVARAKASAMTNMVLDPVVLEKIQKLSGAIGLAGGPLAIMAKAAAQREQDPAGLIGRTAELKTLQSLLTREWGREKNNVRHAEIGDALMKLSSLIAANENRLKVHDANVTRKATEAAKAAEADQKIGNEMAQFQSLAPSRFPDLTDDETTSAAGAIAKGATAEYALGSIQTGRDKAAQARKDAEAKARMDERLKMAKERQELAVKGFALRVEAAARAVHNGKIEDYEKLVGEAKEDVKSAEKAIDLISTNPGVTPEEIEAAKQTWYGAVAHLREIRSQRPTNAAPADRAAPSGPIGVRDISGGSGIAPAPPVPVVPEGPVWTDDEAKEAARAEVAKSPGKRDEIIAKWKALVGKPK